MQTLSFEYFDLSVKLFDIIFSIDNGWFSSSSPNETPLYKKIFLVKEEEIETIPLAEREAFMKVLAYLMFEDGEIDATEKFVVELWLNILNLDNRFVDTLDSYSDVSMNTVDNIQTSWFIHFLVFSFIMSQQNNEKDYSRLSSFIKFKNTKELKLDEVKTLTLKFRDTTQRLMNELRSYDCDVNNGDECNFVIEGVMDFLHNRRNKTILYELVDLKSNDKSDTVTICIDGFLSENDENQFRDWQKGLDQFSIFNLKGYKWPSGISTNRIKDITSPAVVYAVANVARSVPIIATSVAAITIIALWKDAIGKSEEASRFLLESINIIYSMKPNAKIILMGHSLGARVIYNTLIKMNRADLKIYEAYMFGGAVSRHNKIGWMHALSSVEKNVYNFYSMNDNILAGYKAAQFDDPIGIGEIEYHSFSDIKMAKLINIDTTEIIGGHTEYKDHLRELIDMAKSTKSTIV